MSRGLQNTATLEIANKHVTVTKTTLDQINGAYDRHCKKVERIGRSDFLALVIDHWNNSPEE